MNYSYNNKKFKELIESGTVTKTTLRRICGGNNYSTINRWIEGEDIYIKKLLSICNEFNLDLNDFLVITGKNTNRISSNKETDTTQPNIDSATIIEYERKIASIRFDAQKELFKERENKIKELATLEIKLHKEAIAEIETERARLKKDYKSEINQVESDFKKQLKEKDIEIFELKKQLSDFQLAYKELELKAYAKGIRESSAATDTSKPYQKENDEEI